MVRPDIARLIQGLPTGNLVQCDKVVVTILEAIREAVVSGDLVELRRFGSFYQVTRKPRHSKMPNGQIVDTPAKNRAEFRPVKDFLTLSSISRINKKSGSSQSTTPETGRDRA